MRNVSLLWILLCLTFAAWGQTTHYITNSGDNGPGSLRQTIVQAFPNDTIRFAVRGTIFLVSGELTINKNLVIEGPGMDSLTIAQLGSGIGSLGLLDVNTASFRLTGLTLEKGYSEYHSGTGLRFDGTDLYLKDVRLDSCRSGHETPNYPSLSGGYGREGGAMEIITTTLTMEDCVFKDNSLYSQGRYAYGGSAYILATDVAIRGCRFEDSKVKSDPQAQSYRPSSANAYGGALYLDVSNHVVIERTTFDNCRVDAYDFDTRNSAYTYGGGLHIESAAVVDVHDCTFDGSISLGVAAGGRIRSYSYGGGLSLDVVDSLHLTGCVFDNSTAGGGGSKGDGSAAYLYARINVLKNNEVLNANVGSAVSLVGNSVLENNHIHDNRAVGVATGGRFRMERCVFERNSGSAIAVFAAAANNRIVNCTFYQNSATEGAAINAEYNTYAINVINCTMVDNASTSTNGALAIYTAHGTVHLKNTIISNTVFSPKPLVALGTGGLILSSGGNILRDNSMLSFLTQPNDRNATDPRLGTLANHGGLLPLFDLQATSPAINLGGVDTLATDQRGFLRDANPDAGSYEFGAANPSVPVANVTTTTTIACENTSSQFVVASSGATPLFYQWFLNGVLVPGATEDTLTIASTSPTDAGFYHCEVSNSLDTVASDSIVLIVNPISNTTDVQTACNSYTWIDGNTYTASNNSATVTLTNVSGCDSVVTLDLTVNSPTTSTDVQTACNSYTWIDGNTYTASNNSATVTLTNASGCDSVVTLDLTINFADTTVVLNGNSLVASAFGVAYQWLDCDNNHAPIVGATLQSFTPSTNGNYALAINQQGCIDTSTCIGVTVIDVHQLPSHSTIHIYPNPTTGQFYTELGETETATIRIYDMAGQCLQVHPNITTSPYELKLEAVPGVYLVEVKTAQVVRYFQLIRQ